MCCIHVGQHHRPPHALRRREEGAPTSAPTAGASRSTTASGRFPRRRATSASRPTCWPNTRARRRRPRRSPSSTSTTHRPGLPSTPTRRSSRSTAASRGRPSRPPSTTRAPRRSSPRPAPQNVDAISTYARPRHLRPAWCGRPPARATSPSTASPALGRLYFEVTPNLPAPHGEGTIAATHWTPNDHGHPGLPAPTRTWSSGTTRRSTTPPGPRTGFVGANIFGNTLEEAGGQPHPPAAEGRPRQADRLRHSGSGRS